MPIFNQLFVLGSASPRRLELLRQVGYEPDKLDAAEIDEAPKKGELPRLYVARMAQEKYEALRPQYPDAVLLTADTVVACGRRIMGKPQNVDHARRYLELLSGRRHRVYSSVCVNGQIKTVMTQVKFKRLSAAEIDAYLRSEEWQGKAGGYAIQGQAAAFVPSINGSYSNVVGLPLCETANLLRSARIEQ